MYRVFFALSVRELRAWVYSPALYCHVAFFAFLSLAGMFLLSGFIDANDAEISRSFFRWHPWVYAILAPVIGIRSWSEEHASQLFESLGAQPLPFSLLTLAKSLGAFFVISLSLLATFPAVITVTWLGEPDLGVIACAYIGSFLLGLSVALISLAICAYMRGSIGAYICSAGLTLILIIIGTDQVANTIVNTFPGLQWSTQLLSALSLTSKYAPFLQGRLQADAVGGFLLIIIAAIFAAQLALMSQRSRSVPQSRVKKFFNASRVWLGIVAFVVVAMLVSTLPGMWDMSEGRRNSLPPGVINQLSKLDRSVTVRVYATKNHPKFGYNEKHRLTLINETIKKMRRASNGHIHVKQLNPNESSHASRLAAADDIKSKTTDEGEPLMFSVVVESLDNKRVFNLLQSPSQESFIAGIVKAVIDVSRDKKSNVGLLTPFSKTRTDTLAISNWTGITALEHSYSVKKISIDDDWSRYQTIIVHNFSIKSEKANKKLKNYVGDGGNLVLLADPFSLMVNTFSQSGSRALLSSTLPDFVEKRGIRMPAKREVYDFALSTQHPTKNGVINDPTILTLGRNEFDQHNAITSGFDYVHLFHTGYLEVSENNQYKTTVLIRSSAQSTAMPVNESNGDPIKRIEKAMDAIKTGFKGYALMVMQQPKGQNQKGQGQKGKSQEGTIIVGADSDWLFSAASGEKNPDGSITRYNNNIALLQSIVDYLSEGASLHELMLADASQKPLEQWQRIRQRTESGFRDKIKRVTQQIARLQSKIDDVYKRRDLSSQGTLNKVSQHLKSLKTQLRVEQSKLTRLRSLRQALVTQKKNLIQWSNVLGPTLFMAFLGVVVLTLRARSTRGRGA